MKKTVLFGVALAVLFTGCANTSISNEEVEETTTTEASATESESVAETTKAELPDYVHGEEGYFSLADNGMLTDVKAQTSGTCWVVAAASSMESAYLMENGEEITIDPLDVLSYIYSADRTEGIFIDDGADKLDWGGWAWMITETLCNGAGDYVLVDSSYYNDMSIDEIKDAIAAHGAMNVAINDTHPHLCTFNNGYMTLNTPKDEEEFDHAVVLVGWDDNFPKELFYSQPEENGAWLAMNTRGEGWGNDGFFWISYEAPLSEMTVFEMSSDYTEVVAYDWGKEGFLDLGEEVTLRNDFHHEGLLRGVGTYTEEDNQTILVEVMNKDLTEVLFSRECTFEGFGYHTIWLDEPLQVKDYSIVVTYQGKAPVEGASWEIDVIDFNGDIEPGQSFVFVDNTWYDLADEATMGVLGIDEPTNNCCIKAIY